MTITKKHCPCNGSGAITHGDSLEICTCPAPITVEGRVDPETGAGVETLVRRFVEKLGRAGKLPPTAQAEFDARKRS